ncbi:MAG TPA: hypothetical protein VFU55_13460 [Terracidiphilus sp.]|nr:hypothetical protein [Terracidiphilus sp.]
MKSAILPLFVLFVLAAGCGVGITSAQAQTASPNQRRWSVPEGSELMQMLPAESCPVRMELQQRFEYAPRFAGKDATVQGPAPRIRIVLSSLYGDPVVKAKLTVVGWDTGAHLVPVAGAKAGSGRASGDMSRTLVAGFTEAGFTSGGDGSSAELALPGFSAVRLVQLRQVTFAGGTTMNFAPEDNCQAGPNPMVLVTAR